MCYGTCMWVCCDYLVVALGYCCMRTWWMVWWHMLWIWHVRTWMWCYWCGMIAWHMMVWYGILCLRFLGIPTLVHSLAFSMTRDDVMRWVYPLGCLGKPVGLDMIWDEYSPWFALRCLLGWWCDDYSLCFILESRWDMIYSIFLAMPWDAPLGWEYLWHDYLRQSLGFLDNVIVSAPSTRWACDDDWDKRVMMIEISMWWWFEMSMW